MKKQLKELFSIATIFFWVLFWQYVFSHSVHMVFKRLQLHYGLLSVGAFAVCLFGGICLLDKLEEMLNKF